MTRYSSAVTESPSDDQLVNASKAGDRKAFGELVRRYQRSLWATAFRLMKNPQEADDALQDALLSAYTNIQKFQGRSAITTWMHAIVVNSCNSRWQQRTANQTYDPTAFDEWLADTHETDHSVSLDVRSALDRLAPEQRIPILLVDVEGWSVAEAAVILGVPEGTIKSRCSRGRAILARRLGHLGPSLQPIDHDEISQEGQTP
jgi:RNA polymerase sigma-70 factor (ECF subfamily)